MTPGPGFVSLIGLPGQGEWIILLILGLLLFGRRLPEVGRQLGKTVVNFRRGLADFKHELDRDESLRDARQSVSEIKRAMDVPRIATDPGRFVKQWADDAIHAPLPDEAPKSDTGEKSESSGS
ncbi:MAG: twin-arginine translocase TatA/TatE family subunit [Planctomycetes bacterium]|nr:twin-arginine translocase TatA/TatE family subunit [Planctomycetota bacterium]